MTEVWIERCETNTPLIPIKVGNQTHSVLLDTGSKFEATLAKSVLESCQAKSEGKVTVRDITGKSYTQSTFQIPQLSIGNQIFENVLATKTANEFVLNTDWSTDESNEEKIERHRGHIGRGLIKNVNILIDYKQNKILLSKSTIPKKHYNLRKFQKYKFDKGKLGYIIPFETDFGIVKLALDTGSTLSLIRQGPYNTTTQYSNHYKMDYVETNCFKLDGHDYGSQKLFTREISDDLTDMDGVLGMDFIQNHVIFIDNNKGIIHIL